MDEKDKEKSFRVVDKRHFTSEGEPVPAAGEGEVRSPDAQTAPEPVDPATAATSAPSPGASSEATVAGGEPQKKTLRERIFGKKKDDETGLTDLNEPAPATEEEPLPDIDFASFILSLVTSAFIHLGEAPDPITKKRERSLPLAKQTIDLLSIMAEKTKGNLSPDESRLLDGALYDLRMRYVQLNTRK